jgi:hypothetical protein
VLAEDLEQFRGANRLACEVAHQHHGVRVEVRGIQAANGLDKGFPWVHPAQIEGVGVALLAEAVVQRIDDQFELGAPPPVERGAADLRVGCDVADGHARVAVADEAVTGGQDDRLVERGVAWPTAGPRPRGAGVRVLVRRCACSDHEPTSWTASTAGLYPIRYGEWSLPSELQLCLVI